MSLKTKKDVISKGFPTKSFISCIFQALGPFPLDPERISDQFWYWKCSDPSEKKKESLCVFLELKLTVPGKIKIDSRPIGHEFKLKVPGIFNLNSAKPS